MIVFCLFSPATVSRPQSEPEEYGGPAHCPSLRDTSELTKASAPNDPRPAPVSGGGLPWPSGKGLAPPTPPGTGGLAFDPKQVIPRFQQVFVGWQLGLPSSPTASWNYLDDTVQETHGDPSLGTLLSGKKLASNRRESWAPLLGRGNGRSCLGERGAPAQ